MKAYGKLLTTSAIVLGVCSIVYGDDKPAATAASGYGTPPAQTAPTSPSAGLMNDWLRKEWPGMEQWDIGGQIRIREELKDYFAAPGVAGAVDFRKYGGDAHNDYLMIRQTAHIGYTPCKWITFFAEDRESSTTGDDRNPNAESNIFDLHQGYVKLGNAKEFPLTLKVGRQEMIYGDERLIGAVDWTNLGRTFDAVKLRYENQDIWVDAFVSRPVLINDGNFDVANDYDYLSGVYASTRTLIPKQETELYFLARNTGLGSPTATTGSPQAGGSSPRDIYTIGARVKSLPGAYGPWDYEGEFAGQFGRYKETAAAASQSQEAFAAHVAGGYTFKEAWATPRVSLEYNFASGDDNPTDNKHGTFDNLFPSNHKFYGYMDMIPWQNMHNLRFAGSIKPIKKLTVTVDYHTFWLASTSDSFYGVTGARRGGTVATPAGGYGINPNYSNYLGSEVDLIATYAIKPYALLQAGYMHFFTGSYVNSSLAGLGGSTDADYVYLQTTLNF